MWAELWILGIARIVVKLMRWRVNDFRLACVVIQVCLAQALGHALWTLTSARYHLTIEESIVILHCVYWRS